MIASTFDVGAFVWGGAAAPRGLASHSKALAAYADGGMADQGEAREAYLSHFAFGAEMQAHYDGNHDSVAGFAGPCWCRRLTLDVDREGDLGAALADTRRLVTHVRQRYGLDDVLVYFSGSKGFHLDVELANNPPPSVGFQRVAKAFAEAVAARSGVRLDTSVYDVAHLIRLPNTLHPRTGLYKRRIDADALFQMDVDGIKEHAKQPAGDGLPAPAKSSPALVEDWREAEQATARAAEARTIRRAADAGTPDARAPRWFMEFFRFDVVDESRHLTLFRCAAWLTEQGAPPSLCSALLTEPGLDSGLSLKDVERQIDCGIEHGKRQKGATAEPPPAPSAGQPDPQADPDAFERWAIQHEGDPLPPGATDFPFGAFAPAGGMLT